MFFCSLKYFLSWSVPSLRLQLPGSPGLLHKLLPEFRGLFLLKAFFLATKCLPFEKVAEVMSASVTSYCFVINFFFSAAVSCFCWQPSSFASPCPSGQPSWHLPWPSDKMLTNSLRFLYPKVFGPSPLCCEMECH